MQTRTSNSIRNSTVAFLAQILSIILSFITRTVFIKTLGAEYLGVNGLFSNILSILAFAELGIGTAIVYAMYKPLANNDEKKISALMNLYAKSYKLIGVTIAISGLALMPFLDYLIKEKPDISFLTLIYLMFLTNSVISYFFAYKRSIIIASQKGYINTLNQILFLVIQNLIQIFILLILRQYILYLAIQIICTLLSNIAISIKADKLFPYIKSNHNETVDKYTKKEIKKNVLAMISHKIGGVIVTGTDNLLISAFVGVYWVGLYSNYVLIINTVQSLIRQMINGITASVGHLTATENANKSYNIFKKIFFINYIITLFCATLLIVLLNPFIRLWIGEGYMLNNTLITLIVINFAIIQMRQPSITFIATYGLFWQIKWKSLVEASINLVFSLLLLIVYDLGITGVLLGTMISNLLTNVWWEPYTTYKYGFKIELKHYFVMYIRYLSVGLFAIVITIYICNTLNLIGILELAIKFALCVTIPSVIIIISFSKSEEFVYSIQLIKKVLLKRF